LEGICEVWRTDLGRIDLAIDLSDGMQTPKQVITTLPNQVAARNSRGRLSFVASGFAFTHFTFIAGAHPAVRELFRSGKA
jgi:hypothetical protein